MVDVGGQRMTAHERDELLPQPRKHPVVPGRGQSRGDVHGLVPGGRPIEPDPTLSLERLHASVERAAEDHPPVRGSKELFPTGPERVPYAGGIARKGFDRGGRGHTSSAKSWCGSSRYDLTFATN